MKVYESIWRLLKVYEGIWKHMEVYKVYPDILTKILLLPLPTSLRPYSTLFDLIRSYFFLFYLILP